MSFVDCLQHVLCDRCCGIVSRLLDTAYVIRKRYQKLYYHFKPEKFFW